ncbi:unnamed protein product [Hymenolepis diminuta]|uniref:Uncharacterized protein n=1 Tax=Hymenolepis diminuta TaxID=6216 RepID=A0A564XXX8_HYMDI|nr:unnamed protein product [Hymenolepis diminuta]
MGNQPPAVPPHQNLVLANPDEFHSTISQESNPTVMAPVSSSPMTISKSLLPTSNVMRRPAPRPPVNTAQRSPPSPPVTMAANNPISQNFTAIANGIIADPLKDDSIQSQSLSTFSRNLSSQLSTEPPISNFNPEPPLPRLPIQLLPSLEEESSHSSTLSKIPEEDDNTSQASTVVVVVQSHHQPHQQQHRSPNSPSASVSTTSSSTTLPLSSSPQRTRSSVHTTPAESSDTEGEDALEKSTRR